MNKLTFNRFIEFLNSKNLKHPIKVPKYLNGFAFVRTTNFFDDKYSDFCLIYRNGVFIDIFACSTRAGKYWVYNPVTYGGIKGVAVLLDGLYPKTWWAVHTYRFGFYSIELQQVRNVRVARDGNKNDVIDISNIQEGLFGINIHIGGTFLSNVDRWSAGCIVIPKDQYDLFTKYIQIGSLYDGYLITL